MIDCIWTPSEPQFSNIQCYWCWTPPPKNVRKVCVFLFVCQFPPQKKLNATILLNYCWSWCRVHKIAYWFGEKKCQSSLFLQTLVMLNTCNTLNLLQQVFVLDNVYFSMFYLVNHILWWYLLHLLNKRASVSSEILVGHVTSSQNESDLSKYLMVHE